MGRKKTVLDAELLEVARSIFVTEGYGASTRKIARQAGVSEGVIFQRFSTKDELFFAAMIPPAADLTRMFQQSRKKGRELIRQLTLSMLDYCRRTLPVLLPLMTHPGFRFEDLAERHPDSPLILLRRELVHFLIREKDAGRMGDIEPGAAALLVWSTAQSLAFFERLGAHRGKFQPEMIDATIECMWKGLAPK